MPAIRATYWSKKAFAVDANARRGGAGSRRFRRWTLRRRMQAFALRAIRIVRAWEATIATVPPALARVAFIVADLKYGAQRKHRKEFVRA